MHAQLCTQVYTHLQGPLFHTAPEESSWPLVQAGLWRGCGADVRMTNVGHDEAVDPIVQTEFKVRLEHVPCALQTGECGFEPAAELDNTHSDSYSHCVQACVHTPGRSGSYPYHQVRCKVASSYFPKYSASHRSHSPPGQPCTATAYCHMAHQNSSGIDMNVQPAIDSLAHPCRNTNRGTLGLLQPNLQDSQTLSSHRAALCP